MQKDFTEIFDKIDAIYKAKQLPKLKTLLKGATTNLSNLVNLLVRKSLLKENLYSYSDDNKESFYLPEEKPFLEGEKSRVVYDRLKATLHAFDILANTLPNDIYSVSIKFIENIKTLLAYFSFNNLVSSSNINSRAIKEMCDRLLAGNDKIINKVVQDNLKLLSDNYNRINSIADELLRIKKEEYKYNIRFKVFPFLSDSLTEKLLKENPTSFLKSVMEYMKASTPDIPIYKNWLLDALTTCFSKTETEEIERLKNSFLSQSEKSSISSSIQSPREKLIKIINEIANVQSILEKLYLILEINLKVLKEKEESFFEKIFTAIKKAVNSTSDEIVFELEYINPKSQNIEKETLNVLDFITTIKKKIVLYRAILDQSSAVSEKIKRGTEESLYKFIEDNYFELLLIKERTIGLDAEMKLKISRKSRLKLKEIKEQIEKFDEILREIGSERRKYVVEQEKNFMNKK